MTGTVVSLLYGVRTWRVNQSIVGCVSEHDMAQSSNSEEKAT